MKDIVNRCKNVGESIDNGKSKIKQEDCVKLRLRGQGSGYKEGPRNEESSEPLHLCVSSKYLETYQKACQLTEKLINDIYDQYYKHCRTKNKSFKHLKINRHENSNTRKSSGSSNSSKRNNQKKKHNRNQSHGNGTYNISNYPPISTPATSDFLNKSKHKSDSKKQYNHAPLGSSNFDFYGMYDGNMGQPYMHPQSLGMIRGNPSYPKKPFLPSRKLFTSDKKAEGREFYPTHPKPDFN